MSSQSELSVCNLAILSIGARASVSSINPSDGSAAGDACSTLFSFVFEQLARVAKWGCLNRQLTLTLIQAAQGTSENPDGTSLPIPQQPWLYAYLYPPDCLMMRQLFPPVTTSGSALNQLSISNSITPCIPGQYQIPYATGYSTDSSGNPLEVILTNQEGAVANYTVNQQNPSSWDSLFTSAYVAALAAYLVPALSLNAPLMANQIKIAERLIAQARAADSNETPISQDSVPDWIRARGGVMNDYSCSTQNWITMNWPVC